MRWLLCFILGLVVGVYFILRVDVDRGLLLHSGDFGRDTVTVIDTVVMRDTVRVPVEVVRYQAHVDTVLLYTVTPCDTTISPAPVEVEVPIEQQQYRGDGWRAWVSGYHAALDSLTIDRSTVTIEREVTRWKRKRWGWQVGAGVSIDHRARITPAIFAGFGYTF